MSVNNTFSNYRNVTVGVERERPDVFNYKRDFILFFSNKEYSIKELVNMNDEAFQEVYDLYEKEFGYKMETTNDAIKVLSNLIIVNTMERILLERKLIRLEQKIRN